jgi:molecular chaperone DnaK (HSP70)
VSIGIDFGTSNFSVSRFVDDIEVIPIGSDVPLNWNFENFNQFFPSVFSYNDGDYLYGWEAISQGKEMTQAVKTLLTGHQTIGIGNKQFSADKVASLLFRAVAEKSKEHGLQIEEAVVTIPSNISARTRYRTKSAAGLAGIRVKALIKEPTAAAIGYAHKIGVDHENLLVFDWGGGTIDVTLLENNHSFYTEIISLGRPIGGFMLDYYLGELIQKKTKNKKQYNKVQEKEFKLAVERLKINLSSVQDPNEELPIVTPEGLEVGVTRKEFERELDWFIESAMEPVKEILKKMRLEPEQIDDFIMVGGSSAIPLAREKLSELMKSEVVSREIINPFTLISEGAAVAAAQIDEKIEGSYSVLSDLSIGVATHKKEEGKGYQVIIPAGVSLPYKESQLFESKNAKDAFQLEIYETAIKPVELENTKTNEIGKRGKIPLDLSTTDADKTVLLGKFTVQNPDKSKKTQIKVTLTVDTSGILHVSAIDTASQAEILKDKVDFYEENSGLNDPEITSEIEIQAKKKMETITPLTSSRNFNRDVSAIHTGPEIFLDASNVAHEGIATPTFEHVESCRNELNNLYKNSLIHVIADATFLHKLQGDDKKRFSNAIKNNEVITPAAGAIGKADRLILEFANRKKNSIVVSNDSFQEFQVEFPWLRTGDRLSGAKFLDGIWVFQPRIPPAPRLA